MKVCKLFLEKISQCNAEKRGDKEKENRPGSLDTGEEDDDDTLQTAGLTELSLNIFLDTIALSDDIHSFAALVNISTLPGKAREQANSLAKLVWDYSDYWFV